MRNLKFLIVTALLAVATNASAQFTIPKTKSSASTVSTDGWSTLWVEWNPSTLKVDVKNADDISFTGFSAGYSQTFSISSPIFLEVGLGIQYAYNTESDDISGIEYESKSKTTLLSAKVPVNLMYAFQIPNSSVSLMPFVGATLRYNISGKSKTEYDEYYKDEDYDLFDKKDMGSSSETWKRLQLGYQIGVKARFGDSFILGVSYGSDFSEIAKKCKFSTTSISIGYAF